MKIPMSDIKRYRQYRKSCSVLFNKLKTLLTSTLDFPLKRAYIYESKQWRQKQFHIEYVITRNWFQLHYKEGPGHCSQMFFSKVVLITTSILAFPTSQIKNILDKTTSSTQCYSTPCIARDDFSLLRYRQQNWQKNNDNCPNNESNLSNCNELLLLNGKCLKTDENVILLKKYYYWRTNDAKLRHQCKSILDTVYPYVYPTLEQISE